MFRIEMLPAGHGDSLLIAYGEPAAPRYALIDGGPYYTFQNDKRLPDQALNPRLERLVAQGGSLELLVNTHVDADHIEGVVKLLGNTPPGLQIRDVWFNGWRHLRPEQGEVRPQTPLAQTPPAKTPLDMLGAVHGEMLSALIQHKALRWNAALGGRQVAAPANGPLPTITLEGGLKLTLLSPRPSELEAMVETWDEELQEAGLTRDDPAQAMERLKKSERLRPKDLLGEAKPDVEALREETFEGDASPANGCSIAFIAEFEGRRCLFGADAHPDVLEDSLRRLARQWREPRVRLDAFKIAHHGSGNNISQSLLERVECPRYLISTNGRYFAHPDKAAIAQIILHGGRGSTLYFNYETEQNRMWQDDGLKRDYNYETVYPKGKEPGILVDL